jgi:hypothetical protein
MLSENRIRAPKFASVHSLNLKRMSHKRCVAIFGRLLLRRTFETQRPGRSYAVGVGLGRLVCHGELSRSVHRLDQVSRSLAPEDGVGSFVEVVE